jgi:hypothetical protein
MLKGQDYAGTKTAILDPPSQPGLSPGNAASASKQEHHGARQPIVNSKPQASADVLMAG